MVQSKDIAGIENAYQGTGLKDAVMKYSAGFIGITEERNQSYGDALADWKTPVCFVPLPLYLKIRLKRKL